MLKRLKLFKNNTSKRKKGTKNPKNKRKPKKKKLKETNPNTIIWVGFSLAQSLIFLTIDLPIDLLRKVMKFKFRTNGLKFQKLMFKVIDPTLKD